MPKKLDLSGKKFGRLTALYSLKKPDCKVIYWECICECGQRKPIRAWGLTSGRSSSCGRCREMEFIGKKFGKLTLKTLSHYNKHSQSLWNCLCDCGKEKKILYGSLTSGKVTSCGCNYIKDLSGQTFEYLTVLYYTDEKCGSSVKWMCECLCGNKKSISSESLVRGLTTSCGCRVVSKLHEATRDTLVSLGIEIYKEEGNISDIVENPPYSRQRFDFIIRLSNRSFAVVEANGIQHYEIIEHWGGEKKLFSQIECDQRKANILKEHNIPLIITRYDDADLESVIQEQLNEVLV